MSRVSKSQTAIIALSSVVVVALIIVGIFLANRSSDTPATPQAETPAQTDTDQTETNQTDTNQTDDSGPAGDSPASSDTPATDQYQQLEGYQQIERRLEGDPLAIGQVDAPVVMVVYSDYQCGFCARWSGDTLPQLNDYIEAGSLRIEWRDANIFGEDSARAAHAAYAAGLQGHYLDYHQRLFAGSTTQDLSQEALESYATELNLDVDQFINDMESPSTQDAVLRNQLEAQQISVTSTPSFIIGGIPVLGAQPVDVFIDTIDAALQLNSQPAS